MSGTKIETSRRAFFLRGGAALGAGVATTAGAAALVPGAAAPLDTQFEQLQRRLAGLEDREAIRQLHLAFTALLESGAYEAAAELFDEQAQLQLSGVSATGRPAIRQLFAGQYRQQQAPVMHCAYRRNAMQQADSVTLGDDGLRAAATFHVEVELATPLQADCTAAQMARLQGQMADRRWEAGRFVAQYVRKRGQWRIASLNYMAV